MPLLTSDTLFASQGHPGKEGPVGTKGNQVRSSNRLSPAQYSWNIVNLRAKIPTKMAAYMLCLICCVLCEVVHH